jgi:hypothetical protein
MLGDENSPMSMSPTSNPSILERLNTIEAVLGLNNREPQSMPAFPTPNSVPAEYHDVEDAQLRTVWDSVAVLRRISAPASNPGMWSWAMIKKLWFS